MLPNKLNVVVDKLSHSNDGPAFVGLEMAWCNNARSAESLVRPSVATWSRVVLPLRRSLKAT